MSKQRRRDTAPGLRYRVDTPLPGMTRRRADMLFTRRHVTVFVDGCFWYSCPLHGTLPCSNHGWWVAKLEKNVSQDHPSNAHLPAIGRVVLRFWEHEDMDSAAEVIEQVLRSTDR